MNPLSKLFANPAVKILEQSLWADARRRYLVEHPADQDQNVRTIAHRAEAAYKHDVRAAVREQDDKIRAKWHEFKHGMSKELSTALSTVLRMSDIDWYSVEIGEPTKPDAVAVPYELLKHASGALLYQILRKKIEFEDLTNEALRALARYAADEKFLEIVEHARRNHVAFKIGDSGAWFVLVELIKDDSYFIEDEKHHSRLDMLILRRVRETGREVDRQSRKLAAKVWLHEDREKRPEDRRFSPDGWEIDADELKSWLLEAKSV